MVQGIVGKQNSLALHCILGAAWLDLNKQKTKHQDVCLKCKTQNPVDDVVMAVSIFFLAFASMLVILSMLERVRDTDIKLNKQFFVF